MEAEEDMIVLVVVDDDERATIPEKKNEETSEACIEVDDILKTAQKHGQYLDVKIEPVDDYPCDYLEDDLPSEPFKKEIKEEPNDDTQLDKDEDYIPDDEEFLQQEQLEKSSDHDRHRFAMLKPWQRKSFVAELRQQYKDLRDDEELLMNTLEQIMRSVKVPPPPKDFYIMNGMMFECAYCGFLSDTVPAASRHYQEKHGERYLVCYACGVDFRSTTNLYKHEKRCIAPDANLVLKARAVFLGCKGRSRPYLGLNKNRKREQRRFPCQMCSAVFITKSTLESHENLHRGERPFRCHVCPCAYTSYSALSRHAKKHTNIQFICDSCGRSFKIKAALVAHMDTHKPTRKHGCTECSRRFAQKSALMLHVNRVHRNLPPPCGCQICPKRYPRMSLLKAHMKRAHGLSIITRKMFFKSLPTMSELEIKQSKVILKYEEDDSIDFLTQPIKTEVVEEVEDQEDKEDDSNETSGDGNAEESQDMTVNDLLQYVSIGDQEMGTNVIYIQNGEVVQINADGSAM